MNVDWLSAIGMLSAGLIVGFMVMYGMRGREQKSDNGLRDLEAKRDLLIEALREVVDTNGPAEERARLERETAEVLKAIDAATGKPRGKRDKKGGPVAVAPAEPVAVAAAAPVSAARATIKGFAWGAASIAVIAGIAWFVTQSAKPKNEAQNDPAAAMGGMQGNAAAQQSQQAQQADPALQSLEAAVQKTPDDLSLRNDLAKAYLDRENAMGAYQQAQYVLQRQPNDPKALTYQAIVRIAMGQADSARTMLETARKQDPDFLDASVALAWAYMVGNRADDAQKVIDDAAKRHPDEKDRLTQILAQMREKQKQASAMPQHPPIPQDGNAMAADTPVAAPASADGGAAVHVSVNLAPGVPVPATAVIFVIARDAGVSGGPPLAVKRAMPAGFPVKVDLTQADSMMGQPLPPKMHIEVRLDTDGNPMTHDPKDPSAAQDNVAVGGSVVLTLK